MKRIHQRMKHAWSTRLLSGPLFASGPIYASAVSRYGLPQALLVVAGVVLCLPSGVVAQTSATVDGVVHDPTGALIPQAQIQLKNKATARLFTTVSNKSGTFSFSGVDTGDYSLAISAPGFEVNQIAGIHLDPGDQRTFRDIVLKVGDTSEVTVTDVQGQISTDSGETSTLISSADIDHLAIEGRDVTELLKILPGFAIVTNSTTFANAAYDPSIVSFGGASGQYSGNGTQVNSTAILSDGMDITDPGSYGAALQNVNYDQVAEVKVQTGSFTADTAHGPVVINAIGKAGSSTYHGSLYTYARTYQLNSVDWIAKFSGEPAPHDRQLYPGYTIGGPVRIPGTNFNRNKKLTFFSGAEEYAQRNIYAYGSAYSATVSAIVPTAAMRMGDFSNTQLNAYLGPNRVGNACANSIYVNICSMPAQGPGGLNAQPITNGNISAYIDPLGQRILNSLPLPNVPNNGQYNYITTDFTNSNLYQLRERLDYAMSDRTHMFLAYGLESGLQYEPSLTYGRPAPNGQGGGLDIPGNGFTGTATSHVASTEVTSVLSASLTNQFYAGAVYFNQNYKLRNPSAVTGEPYSLLFNNGTTALPSLQTYGTSTYDGFPFETIEDPTYGGDFTKTQLRLAGDNVTKLIQRHTLRAGIFYQWVDHPQLSAGQNTNASLSDYYHPATFTDADGSTVASTGNYTADILEGIIGGISQVNKRVETNLYFYTLAGYVQDHWLATKHMSIDAGVRLEHLTPWTDPHGQGVAIFDAQSYMSGTPLASPGVLYHGIDASVPNTGVPARPAFIEPRFGVVYDFRGDGKTIMRVGYGIYRQHDSYSDGLLSAQTAEGQRSYSTQASGHTFKNLYLTQGNITQASSGFVADSVINTRMAGDDEAPRVQTYNLVLDQRFAKNITGEVGYVGNYGDHLMEATNLRNINALPLGSLYGPEPDVGRASIAGNAGRIWPLFGPANTGNSNLGNLTTADTDAFRPFPLYSQINAIRHRSMSNYNALQALVSWNTKHARVNANYTWSKALGNVAGPDPINLRNDYLPLSFDRTHLINATYSYTVGKTFNERYARWFLNNWELSGITNFQSGPVLNSLLGANFGLYGTLSLPVGTTANIPGYNNNSTCALSGTATSCTLQLSNSNLLGTPDIAIQPTVVGSLRGKVAHQYIDGSAFRLPTLGTNGPTYYGNFRGPAFFNTDLALRREFPVRDKDTLQLRVAAFNWINHANNTFSNLYPGGYNVNFTQNENATNLNADLQTATNQQTGFGSAPIKTGRRVMEVSVRFVF